jgi:hypothetical protein
MFVLGRGGPPRRQSETRHGASSRSRVRALNEFGWHRPLKSAKLDVMKVDDIKGSRNGSRFGPFPYGS